MEFSQNIHANTLAQNTAQNLEHLRARIRAHVSETINTGIPDDQKAAYLEALKAAPRVVELETDALQFVRCCDYNIWAAAERLCLYWSERKALFGERAHLPMTLTGNGALFGQDILSLHAGWPVLLPKTRDGKYVIFGDRRKFLPTATTENRLRALFYLGTLVAQDETAQVDGVLAFVVIVTPRFEDFDRSFAKKALWLTSKVFSMKSHLHTIASLPLPKTGKRDIVEEIIAASLKLVADSGFIKSKLHVEKERGEMLHILEEMGLSKGGIPLFLGGQWRFEMFYEWCTTQDRMERGKYKGLLQVNPLPQSTEKDQKEAKAFKKRQADIINSRQKRERKRQEFASLQKEAQRCKEMHKRLVSENKRLEQAWKAAQSEEANMSPEERILYCRQNMGSFPPLLNSHLPNEQMRFIQQQEQQQEQRSIDNFLRQYLDLSRRSPSLFAAGGPLTGQMSTQEQFLRSSSLFVPRQVPPEQMIHSNPLRAQQEPVIGGAGASTDVNAVASQVLGLSSQERAQVIAMLSSMNGR